MTDTTEKYQEKDHHTHILELPDTYIGSSIEEEKELRIFDNGKFRTSSASLKSFFTKS